ncbi:hypothetical protein E4U58_001392 [Claviceps cyperi]|nr:hypothetical protein E4U58_001392 [Claviceps cyperi]
MHDFSCSSHTPVGSSGSKEPPSADQESNLGNGCNEDPSNGEVKPGLDTPDEKLWENKIFSCLEPLECEWDAIRAHRSLYLEGKILHRDISPHNIIITRPATADGFKGMLIDFDMACTRESDQDGTMHAVGTLPFMAVEGLLKINHTYCHELGGPGKNLAVEGEKQLLESCFQEWHAGTLHQIATRKKCHMANIDYLRTTVMCELPKALDVVKPLCEELWRIIFPPTNLELNFGTPWNNPGELYDPVITVFDKAIRELPKEKLQSDSAV